MLTNFTDTHQQKVTDHPEPGLPCKPFLYYSLRRYSAEDQARLNGFGTLDLPQVKAVYKARPLAGMWATAPFLHNGSVPNLYYMLVPAAERPKKFFVGHREFDPAVSI